MPRVSSDSVTSHATELRATLDQNDLNELVNEGEEALMRKVRLWCGLVNGTLEGVPSDYSYTLSSGGQTVSPDRQAQEHERQDRGRDERAIPLARPGWFLLAPCPRWHR